jgi:secondary thiamine-phosphate synthase enzyme
MISIEIQTHLKEEFLDITPEIQKAVLSAGLENGACVITVPHTTAGLTVNEHDDPDVREDILQALRKTIPDSFPWRHTEGNSPAHVKASLIGSSVLLIVEKGRLVLGTWQGIFFCEFDGPRRRKVHLQVLTGSF